MNFRQSFIDRDIKYILENGNDSEKKYAELVNDKQLSIDEFNKLQDVAETIKRRALR